MKRYNSVITLSICVDHDEQDGSDITVEQTRKAFSKRLCDLNKTELLHHISLEDSIDRQEDWFQAEKSYEEYFNEKEDAS